MTEPADWRFERKMLIGGSDAAQVEAAVRFHPAHFRRLHAARWIQNVYFDGPDLPAYEANVRGTAERAKTRVRWYGEAADGSIEAPQLEWKIKAGLVGRKRVERLPSLTLGNRIARSTFAPAFAETGSLSRADAAALASVSPVLLNRYHRTYFLSGCGRYRLCIDRDLAWLGLQPSNRWPRSMLRGDGLVVLEVKYAAEHDRDAADVMSALPWRVTKSSKYVMGIERVGLRPPS
ncbi:MAG: polyphosphate polymerase domain-containing protein [Proteobacteria bacterium]|nr:polyphosphate polymerase domain-containing protein [Pseudomonadota bacterium]